MSDVRIGRGGPASPRLLATMALATMALAALTTTACGGGPGATATPTAARPPSVEAGCTRARALNASAMTDFSAAITAFARAHDREDAAAERTATEQVRAGFRRWSSALHALADGTEDLPLQSALAEYAGAVTAAVGRVRTPADLDAISTFDDIEIDTAANQFVKVCG